jgi:hypothetical protein
MSVLRNFESKLAGLVEGTFNRAFKSEVRPVEIARKLAREMDEHKARSLSKTYAPNEYVIWLSPRDYEHLEGYQHDLKGELAGYLLEHARRERYALASQPRIEFKLDERLSLGEFGIQTRMAQDEPPPQRVQLDRQSQTMVHSTAERLRKPLQEQARGRNATAFVLVEGKKMRVGPEGVVLGRSRDCDITLSDSNVSRRHAEIRPSGGSWIINDLGSTNGVVVNGRRIDRPVVLNAGDVVELGTSRLTFELG